MAVGASCFRLTLILPFSLQREKRPVRMSDVGPRASRMHNGLLLLSHNRLTRGLIEHRNLHVAFDWLAIAESGNKFRAGKIRQRGVAEAKQRRLFR